MELFFSNSAKKELENLPKDIKAIFLMHLEKIQEKPPRKHMKHGIPCHVEKVTKQARIIYNIKGDRTYILHCFINHKDYEHWYKSYK
jgi:mRNA-degrading endonuclease RelE of RelBE toxin-antitoxin system